MANIKSINGYDIKDETARQTMIYSATPVQIGTWIDGTPVWRQAFDYTLKDIDVYDLQNTDDPTNAYIRLEPSTTSSNDTFLIRVGGYWRKDSSPCIIDDYKANTEGLPDASFRCDDTDFADLLEGAISGLYGYMEFVCPEEYVDTEGIIGQ